MQIYGNLMSRIEESSKQAAPEIGMGATMCAYTDRHAGTIVKITPTQIHVQEDTAVRTDKNGMSDSQSYAYQPNPNGSVSIFRFSKRYGKWCNPQRQGLIIGKRDKYFDYDF